jgi:hypothetical protein
VRNQLLLVTVIAALAWPSAASAQCSANASSCVSCHETQGLRPVLGDAQPWHVDHGFGDLCSACHGGAPGEEDQTRAHRGRREPLVAIEDACAGCHRDDAAARAAGYQAALAARPPEAPSPPPPRAPRVAGTSRPADPYLAALALALALALVVAVRRPRLAAAGPALAAAVRAPTWSPYAAGALLGAIVGTAAVALGRPLAASSAVDKLAAYLGRWWFADAPYYRYQMAPGITWQVWLVSACSAAPSPRRGGRAGALALVARRAMGAALRSEPRPSPGRGLPRRGAGPGRRRDRRRLHQRPGDLGWRGPGAGAFVFMAGMFAGGIPAAWLWYRRAGHDSGSPQAARARLPLRLGAAQGRAHALRPHRQHLPLARPDRAALHADRAGGGSLRDRGRLDALASRASSAVPPTSVLANLVGGVVFGVGMATAGYCPGPSSPRRARVGSTPGWQGSPAWSSAPWSSGCCSRS